MKRKDFRRQLQKDFFQKYRKMYLEIREADEGAYTPLDNGPRLGHFV